MIVDDEISQALLECDVDQDSAKPNSGNRKTKIIVGAVVFGAIALGLGLVVLCEWYFRENPVQFELSREITVADNDLGKLLLAIESAEVNGLHIHPKPGTYKTTLDEKDLTLWIGDEVRISLKQCRVRANAV